MTVQLKPLHEQTIVITGASSGIGLATARMAARRGARVVLAARSEDALRQLVREITQQGGEAVSVVADVQRQDDVAGIARAAHQAFGGFDTWVNNAGVGMYGKLEQLPTEDMRRLFDTNLWGLIYGSLEALKHLKSRGGALINVGSTVSERAVPLQGIYAASKHAVKGFTDALRMELHDEDAPVSVTLVKPGAIDTPFPLNAKNFLPSEPQHVPPVYAPDAVALAILHCAENPVRDVFVGAGGKGNAALGYYAPRLADKYLERTVISGTMSGRPPRPRDQNALDRPSEHLAERGDYPGHVARSSAYTQATLHPVLASAALVGAGLALRALLRDGSGTAASRSQERQTQTRSSRHQTIHSHRGAAIMGIFSKPIKTLDDLFVHTLQDIYYAEQQIVKSLPKMVEKATDSQLKQGFQSHLAETRNHAQRLEQVFRMHGQEPKAVKCAAMDGILEESTEIMKEVDDKDVLDAALASSAQAVEHYEITRYGTLIAFARELGRNDCASVLQQNLDEEKAADQKLTAIAESRVNRQAV
ncbi:MAG: DUF892 family protein [Gemmatimonadales bacterium]|nr:DUF892 family protein [Gemmatimonadales bacterium]